MMADNVICLPAIHDTPEAEALMVGLLMLENRFIDTVADMLADSDFSEPFYGRIYAAIIREASLGRSANPVTLRSYFLDDPQMAKLGGVGYLAQLTAQTLMMPPKEIAQQIADAATRRRMLTGLSNTLDLANDPTATNEEIIESADAALVDATNDNGGVHQLSGSQCFDELLAGFGQPVQGVTCKVIGAIDDLIGPMRPKQLIIGAGRPGMGKTAVALSYGIGAAMNGHGVLFISLEMSSVELAARMAADMCFDGRSGVPFEVIRDATAKTDDIRKIRAAHDMMRDMPFHVVDAGRLTVGRLNMIVRRYARRLAAKGNKLELVIVDYLQLVSPDQRRNSNYEAVSEVSRGLKAIAKDHGVAVFALAQLSREVEKRPDKRPQLSDLRDSGQIEQDADAVLFLSRQEYYVRQEKEAPGYEQALALCLGKIDFICAKRRNGRTGTAEGQFHGEYQAVRG